jgi:hypothetical protein
MIVFGHSLGGNLLATALKDHHVKAVQRHVPGTYMKLLIGNLVVLINPASEAANWTSIQRAVWNQIAFWSVEEVPNSDTVDGHTFFHPEQAPVFVSVTAARSWPPGGVRPADCVWLKVSDPNEDTAAKKAVNELILKSGGMFANKVEYDWATFDAFPFFKGDFRPLSQTLDRVAAKIADQGEPDNACSERTDTMNGGGSRPPSRSLGPRRCFAIGHS